MYTIREFNHSDRDFADVVAVYNADWPDEPTSVDEWRHYLGVRDSSYLDQQFIVERRVDGSDAPAVIATFRICESESSYIPGKYRIELRIQPHWEGKGIEERMYQHVLDYLSRRTPAPKFLDTNMSEDRANRINFWVSRGFEVILREPKSELVVTDYDFSRFGNALVRVANNGIKIFTMTELQQRDPDWLKHYYELFWQIVTDVPSTDQRTPIPFEKWCKRIVDSPNLLPDANFFALNGEQWVGVSNLWKDAANPENLNVGVTGVLPGHRRKGIATALKLMTFRYAIAHGVVRLRTGNEENNPMYDLNMTLGFKAKPALLSLRKAL